MLSWTLLGYVAGIGLVLAFLRAATRKDEEYEEVLLHGEEHHGQSVLQGREWLLLHTPEEQQLLGNMVGLHSAASCKARVCIIHAPTDGVHRAMPMLWRTDRATFERICKHGVGHPDPDQNEYWEASGQSGQRVHGCDGCCSIWYSGREEYI